MYAALVITYNRPDHTAALLEALSGQPVSEIFVFSDGPRDEWDLPRVMEVRDLIDALALDKPVRIYRSEENLGCRRAVTAAIDWVFESHEAAFILEDDCIPTQDFFVLGNFVLTAYANEPRVTQFSGRRPAQIPERLFSGNAFGFDIIGSTWGWATWRRAWELFDRDSKALESPATLATLEKLSKNSKTRVDAIRRGYLAVTRGEVDTWDYHWAMGRLAADSVAVIPARDLVENIGFGPDATHTRTVPFGVSPTSENLGSEARRGLIEPRLSSKVITSLEKSFWRIRFVTLLRRASKRWIDKVYLASIARLRKHLR